jgi:hypothetical protein
MAEPRPRAPAAAAPERSEARGETHAGVGAEEPGRSSKGRIVRTATEARQGEIILGKYGRWIWIGSFVALLILFVLLAL